MRRRVLSSGTTATVILHRRHQKWEESRIQGCVRSAINEKGSANMSEVLYGFLLRESLSYLNRLDLR